MDTNASTIDAKSNVSLNKKSELGQTTRHKILAAAELVFFEKGVSASTLEIIAERAEVTRGAIYWHFKNKDEILNEVLDLAANPLVEKFREILSQRKTPDIMTLRRASVAPMEMIARSATLRRRLAIGMLKCEYIQDNAPLMDKTRYHTEQMTMLLVSYLKAMVAHDNSISLVKPPHIVAEAFFCYWTGLLIQYLKHPERISLVRKASDYADVFLLPMVIQRNVPISAMNHDFYKDK